jgi:hypothetical protein
MEKGQNICAKFMIYARLACGYLHSRAAVLDRTRDRRAVITSTTADR